MGYMVVKAGLTEEDVVIVMVFLQDCGGSSGSFAADAGKMEDTAVF